MWESSCGEGDTKPVNVDSTMDAPIKGMDNERDSLCAFHLRIATFDSGWANAAAEQEAPPTKDGGINPKGWCAVRTLHIG